MKKWVVHAATMLLGLSTLTASASEKGNTSANPVSAEVTQTASVTQPNLNQVNINLATAAELQDKLVGIGEKKALAIVEYREKHGNFTSIEQLTEVSGIGKSTLDKNRDRIVLE